MKRKSLTNRSRVFGVILAVLATAFGISSCRPDFDLDKRMPEWLGTSIYQTLQEGFRNDSTGEFYSFKTFVRLIEDLNQVDILAKTGSKTLFVADDSAFVVFFKNCPFVDANGNKITSYDQLSKAQKSMILNGSMLNNVYQVAMLSNSPGGDNNPPILGNCMRRISAADILDTIPVVKASSLPTNNPYWTRLRNKNEGKSLVLLQDGTERPIIFMVNKFLQSNKIDNEDYDFLFRLGKYSKVGKPAHKPGDASVNGVAIEWPNKKCFNGFLHVMSDVIYLLPNMADYISTREDTKIFNAILDRFSGTRFLFMLSGSNTFSKQERLCSSTQIDRLFSEGNRQISVFPVRLVWLLTDDIKGIQVLISAPKRNFHHAVDRNRIKRQIREFYRTGSSSLKETVALIGKGLALAFLFNDNKLWESDKLDQRLSQALEKLVETLSEK